MLQSVAIAASNIGTNKIVAGVAGKRIRLIAWSLSFSGTVNAKWQDGSTDLTGLRYGLAGGAWDMPMATPRAVAGKDAYLETTAGNDLNLNLSGAVAVGGFVVYELVTV
jgi:hypothetical protein